MRYWGQIAFIPDKWRQHQVLIEELRNILMEFFMCICVYLHWMIEFWSDVCVSLWVRLACKDTNMWALCSEVMGFFNLCDGFVAKSSLVWNFNHSFINLLWHESTIKSTNALISLISLAMSINCLPRYLQVVLRSKLKCYICEVTCAQLSHYSARLRLLSASAETGFRVSVRFLTRLKSMTALTKSGQ